MKYKIGQKIKIGIGFIEIIDYNKEQQFYTLRDSVAKRELKTTEKAITDMIKMVSRFNR